MGVLKVLAISLKKGMCLVNIKSKTTLTIYKIFSRK